MSKLLAEWVHELKLSRPVSDFERDFANGFLFGEILSKLGFQTDFAEFKDSPVPKAMLFNYNLLNPTMRQLGVPLDSRTANDMMTEREGAATKVLYQIKMAISKMEKTGAVAVDESGQSTGLPKKTSLSMTMANPDKEKWLTMETKLYQQRLQQTERKLAERNSKLDTHYMYKFEEEALKHTAKNIELRKQEALALHEHEVRAWQLTQERKREKRREQEDQLAVDMQKWQANQERQHAREEAALRYELSKAERERQAQWERRTLVQMETDGSLSEFERNAQRLGLPIPQLAKKAATAAASGDGDDDEDEGGGGSLALTAAEKRQLETTGGMDALQHLQFLGTKLPDPKTQSRNAHLHMAAIKSKTEADELARIERERRRRKVLVDQQAAAVEAEEKRKQQRLLDMLQRQSSAERAMAEQLWRTQQYKLIMRENRVYREHQMQQRFEQDAQIALARDRQAWLAQQSETESRRAVAARRYQEREAERQGAQRARHTLYCRGLLESLVDVAMKAVAVRALGEPLVPAAVWRGWMAAWVQQAPGVLPPPPAEDGDVAAAAGAPVSDGAVPAALDERDVKTLVHLVAGSSEEANELMDLGQLDDYLSNLGAWRHVPSAAALAQMNALAAAAAGQAQTQGDAPPSARGDGEVSSSSPADDAAAASAAEERAPHHLAMSVVSAPLKASASAARDGVDAPASHTLGALVELITASAAGAQPPAVPQVPPFPLGCVLLGKPFAGKSTLVERITRRYALQPLRVDALVHEAEQEPETEAEAADENESLGARVRATLGSGGTIGDELYVALVQRAIRRAKENARVGGWILVDFPLNLAQAQLLEAVLSGFVLPAVKKGAAASKLAAPPPLPARTDPLASGLDCVLRVDAPHDVLLRRALGRRYDPVTGVHYHVDSRPPPDSEPIKARLVAPPGSEGLDAKLPDQFSAYDAEWPALSEWFAQFQLVHELDPAATEHAVYQQALDVLDAQLVSKKARADAAQAAAATTAAAAAAAAAGDAPAAPAPTDGDTADVPTPRTVAAIPAAVEVAVDTEAQQIAYLRADGLLDQATAQPLAARWRALEDDFCRGARRTFGALRAVRVQQAAYVTRTQRDFVKWLARPSEDKAQQLLTFQDEFNRIDADLRLDDDLKSELHARADDLSDRLWQVTLARKQEAESKLTALRADRFADWQAEAVVQHYTQLVQLELDRHAQTLQVARDACFARGHWTVPVGEAALGGDALVASLPGLVRGVLPTVPEDFKASARYQEWIAAGTGATLAAAASAKAAEVAAAPAASAAAAAKKGVAPATGVDAAAAAAAPSTPRTEHVALIYARVQEVIEAALASAASLLADIDTPPAYTDAVDRAAFDAHHAERLASPALRVLRALRAEQVGVFQRRLVRLRARCEAECAAVRRRCDSLFARCDRALSLRVEGENAAIEALVAVVKAAVERETPLRHALSLEGEDVLIDRNLVLFQEAPAPDTSPLLPPLHAALFAPAQLRALAHQVSAATHRLTHAEFVSLFARLAGANGGAGNAQLAVPRTWVGRDRAFFAQLAVAFAVPPLLESASALPSSSSSSSSAAAAATSSSGDDVDWRQTLVALLLPVCGAPSVQELLASVRSAQAAVARDAAHTPEQMHALLVPVAEFAAVSLYTDRVDALRAFGADAARDVRATLQHAFTSAGSSGTGSGGAVVAVRELLMHLCFDDEYRAGLEKAFAVHAASLQPDALGDVSTTEPRVPVAQLGCTLFRGAATLDSVQKYVQSAIAVAAPADASTSYAELVDSEYNALVAQHYAYRRKDVTRLLQ